MKALRRLDNGYTVFLHLDAHQLSISCGWTKGRHAPPVLGDAGVKASEKMM